MALGQAEFVKELKALGVDVSRETLLRLEAYAALLVKWQAKINLVGPATLPDLWRRHFLDSAQLVPFLTADSLPRAGGELGRGRLGLEGERGASSQPPPQPSPKLGGGGEESGSAPSSPLHSEGGGSGRGRPHLGGGVLVDLGSGAGFPGLGLALMADWRVHLIDSDQRKCAFLRQVALETGILERVTIHPQRFEAVAAFPADIVTARACAPLDELLGYAAPFIGESGRCLFLKGERVEEELTAAQAHWKMRVERRPSRSESAAAILVVDQFKRRKR
jgi:16S rRNA (guanine527-N7)-methyltransferase